MSKEILFFLASSIDDTAADREAIGNFINQINNFGHDQDIYIRLCKCDDDYADHSVKIEGSQKSLDDMIRDSDLCFVIFWHKAGEVTQHELNVAYETFKKKNYPKIVVYFKALQEGETLSEDVAKVMHSIDEELKHYYRNYSHIDSLKLGIITQLNIHGFLKAEMKVDGSDIKIGSEKIASTDDIPLFSENDEYLELVEDYREANAECERLSRLYSANKNNMKVFRAYQKAIKNRDRLIDDITEMSDGILNIGEQIAKIASSSMMTDRIREAIRCFDIGDYDGVLNLLHPDEIENQIKVLDVMEEHINMARRNVIEEYRLRILALEAQGKWSEIYDTYERAAAQVMERPEMPKTIVLEYAQFLYRQGNYQKGIEICERLKNLTADGVGLTETKEIAELYERLGACCYHCMKYDEAEKNLKEALKLRRRLSEGSDAEEIKAADVCVRLAKVLFKVNRHYESEALYSEALEIYRRHDSDGVQEVDAKIANASIELGDLYYMINRHKDAGRVFTEAADKFRELVGYGEKVHRAALAKACDKAANLYIAVFSHLTSDRYYIQAMKVKQALTKGEPEGYYLYLKRILEKLGKLWSECGNKDYGQYVLSEAETVGREIDEHLYDSFEKEEVREVDYSFYEQPIDRAKMEELCKKSLNLYKALAAENPEAFEPSLAQSWNTLGTLYSQTGDKEKAEECYLQAISIRELLAERDPLTMKTDLAASYSNIAYHYYLWEQYEDSENYSRKAIKIYQSVTKKDAGAFNTDLARNCTSIGNLFARTSRRELAESCYFESLTLYILLFKKSPRAYVDRIINTSANIFALLAPDTHKELMNEFLNV